MVALVAIAVSVAFARGGGGSGSMACSNMEGNVTWSPAVVWPPNHKMKTIDLSYVDNGSEGDTNTITVTDISSTGVDDKGAGQPSSKQGPDYSGVGNSGSAKDGTPATTTVQVRAERSGTDKAGRTYTIKVECDSGPNKGMSQAVVTVPHDMGNHNGSGGSSSTSSLSTTRIGLVH